MSERLFFALLPDRAWRQDLRARLAQLTASIDGKPQRPDQWHVTLEFLGQVPDARHAALRAAADRVHPPLIDLEFDRFEHWRKPQVVCLVASRLPTGLETLVMDLRAALTEAGFVTEKRPLRPHVTLARKVRTAVESRIEPPLAWRSDGFVLMRSVTDDAGSRYEPVGWWNHAIKGR